MTGGSVHLKIDPPDEESPRKKDEQELPVSGGRNDPNDDSHR
jgi:hypothetical protein